MNAFTGLVEIFGFELEDASQAPKSPTDGERNAIPRELGSRMGCNRFIRDRG